MSAFPGCRVGVIQSCYLPWRGYFDFIASVDVFVIYDDVQYSTGSWRNRNKVKTSSGLKWITVPVKVSLGQAIDEVLIGEGTKPWKAQHEGLLKDSLGSAPYFKEAFELWRQCVDQGDTHLSALNIRLMRAACQHLGITTPLLSSRDYALSGSKTERLMQLLTALKAGTYLSGPSAQDYLDVEMFKRQGIRLEYKNYDYPPYPQLWGEFAGTVSILDLIANTGPSARDYLRSRSPNLLVG